jgi:hypothetical protein
MAFDLAKVLAMDTSSTGIPQTVPSGLSGMDLTPISAPIPTAPAIPTAATSESPFGTVGSPSEFIPGVVRGAKYGLPGMLGKSAQYLGVGGQAADDLVKWSEEGLQGGDQTWFGQGGEQIVPSMGVQAVATGIGRLLSLSPHPVSKAVGVGLVAAAPYLTFGVFGLSAAQDVKEAAKNKGVDPGYAPELSGGMEAAGELASDLVFAKALGPLG